MEAPQLSSATEQRLALPFAPDAQEEARTVLLSECGTNNPGWKSAGRERLHFGGEHRKNRLSRCAHGSRIWGADRSHLMVSRAEVVT